MALWLAERGISAHTQGFELSHPPALLTIAGPAKAADIAAALLAGLFGSRAWMRQHAARAGRATSPAKAQAARANGPKGGRPRKQTV